MPMARTGHVLARWSPRETKHKGELRDLRRATVSPRKREKGLEALGEFSKA